MSQTPSQLLVDAALESGLQGTLGSGRGLPRDPEGGWSRRVPSFAPGSVFNWTDPSLPGSVARTWVFAELGAPQKVGRE